MTVQHLVPVQLHRVSSLFESFHHLIIKCDQKKQNGEPHLGVRSQEQMQMSRLERPKGRARKNLRDGEVWFRAELEGSSQEGSEECEVFD